jgi:hypothetical protein
MLPLEVQLSLFDFDARLPSSRGDLRSVECVSAAAGFIAHGMQIRCDRAARIALFAKAQQLRMIAIAARQSAQHGLREETFTPQRDEAGRIEIARMDGPESHAVAFSSDAF